MRDRMIISWLFVFMVAGCQPSSQETAGESNTVTMEAESKMKITSTAFEAGANIPKEYTCDGADISPPLEIEQVPDGCESLVLITDDPDAPMGTWVHWVLFNLPANTRALDKNIPPEESLPDGSRQGKNDFGRIGYGGPCPPAGKPHRYYFKVYALNTTLDLEAGATKTQVLRTMEGHVLAEGQLMSRYGR